MGAATMSETLWYYARGEEQVGPVDETQLKQLIDEGSLYPDDLVWRDGMPEWVEAREVPQLYGNQTAYAPEQTPPPPEPVAAAPQLHDPTYAGFWKRFVAFVIDAILIAVAAGIVGLSIDVEFDPWESQSAVQVVVLWLYFALMESSKWQATVGKMALGLRVTDTAGRRLTFGRASGRLFAKYISGAIAMIGFIMAAFTEKKQALHDMIAGTLVVHPD